MSGNLNLESVAVAIAESRAKKEPVLPESIWKDLRTLRSRHKITEMSKVLDISLATLYGRLRQRKTGMFVEVKVPRVSDLDAKGGGSDGVEVRRADGMVVRFPLSKVDSKFFVSLVLKV